MIKQCPICSSHQHLYFQETVLKKYEVDYFYCDICGLLQTEEPYWLEEAYNTAISDADTGLIQRNIQLSILLACTLFFNFDQQGKYLDIGGGYGILTRLMRDIGFDFYWSDPYCKNLFAKGFESLLVNEPFEAITAFEVLEHIYNPLEFVKTSLEKTSASTIILTTELFKAAPPKPSSWNYYAFNTGQHISFYQPKTLIQLAEKLSLSCYSHHNFHILTSKRLDTVGFKVTTSRFSLVFYQYVKRVMLSKTISDHEKLLHL